MAGGHLIAEEAHLIDRRVRQRSRLRWRIAGREWLLPWRPEVEGAANGTSLSRAAGVGIFYSKTSPLEGRANGLFVCGPRQQTS